MTLPKGLGNLLMRKNMQIWGFVVANGASVSVHGVILAIGSLFTGAS